MCGGQPDVEPLSVLLLACHATAGYDVEAAASALGEEKTCRSRLDLQNRDSEEPIAADRLVHITVRDPEEKPLPIRRGDRLRLSMNAGGIVAGGILADLVEVVYVSGN